MRCAGTEAGRARRTGLQQAVSDVPGAAGVDGRQGQKLQDLLAGLGLPGPRLARDEDDLRRHDGDNGEGEEGRKGGTGSDSAHRGRQNNTTVGHGAGRGVDLIEELIAHGAVGLIAQREDVRWELVEVDVLVELDVLARVDFELVVRVDAHHHVANIAVGSRQPVAGGEEDEERGRGNKGKAHGRPTVMTV